MKTYNEELREKKEAFENLLADYLREIENQKRWLKETNEYDEKDDNKILNNLVQRSELIIEALQDKIDGINAHIGDREILDGLKVA